MFPEPSSGVFPFPGNKRLVSPRPPGAAEASANPVLRAVPHGDFLKLRTQGLHDLSTSLARRSDIVDFARQLVRGSRARDRMARIAATFTFVRHLSSLSPSPDSEIRDGIDLLALLAGERQGAAVILVAMLKALGERARVGHKPGGPIAEVELAFEDLARVPPHAGLFVSCGKFYLPLDARWDRSPLGFLPRPVREILARQETWARETFISGLPPAARPAWLRGHTLSNQEQ